MVWLTYRQHRFELGGLLFGAIAIAVGLLVLTQVVNSLKISLGIAECEPYAPFSDPSCAARVGEFSRRITWITGALLGLYVFPALVASFLGGPLLSREFERGTHRLVWTQGLGRVRWVAEKLALVLFVGFCAGLVVAAAGGLSRQFMTGRGASPFSAFDFEGPAMVSYVLFALAFGALVSVIARRSVLAMFVALVGFVGVRAIVEALVRPNYLPPLVIRGFGAPPVDAWTIGARYLSSTGADVSERYYTLMQQFTGPVVQQFRGDSYAYLTANDVFVQQLYQPADRYWLFQSIEAAIFFALAATCFVVTIWLVRRRPV